MTTPFIFHHPKRMLMGTSLVLMFILPLIALLEGCSSFNRAEMLYNQYDYALAIPNYEKAAKHSRNKSKAIQRLAECYQKTQQYTLAETYYAQVVADTNVRPIDYFNYGLALKSNGKTEEAKEQFIKYAALMPNDKKVQVQIASCEDAKRWVAEKSRYEIKNLESINTSRSEFCPVIYRKSLVYVAERENDVVNFEQSGLTQQPFLNIYAVPLKPGKPVEFAGKEQSFSGTINSKFHDGPITFSMDSTMLLTRVVYSAKKGSKTFVNQAKLYSAKMSNNKWLNLEPFPFNSDSFSVAHPTLSEDNKLLIFSSNMPGGFGGKDLYSCTRDQNGKWSKPVNLGPEINSEGDEVFPFLRKDKTLFYSSDGLSGFGGLDIFSSTYEKESWNKAHNEGNTINSRTDDFGICFNDSLNAGYFSSNRSGGKGNDDIYYFKMLSPRFIVISGKMLKSRRINDPLRNAKVLLLTEDGKVVQMNHTDQFGYFKFENLPPDQQYIVKLDEEDPQLSTASHYFLTNEKDSVIRITVNHKLFGKHIFHNLPALPVNPTSIKHSDGVQIAGTLLSGSNASAPVSNTKLQLSNSKGELLQATVTNTFGSFVFKDLSADESYLISADESDVPLASKVTMTNKNGKTLQEATVAANGAFHFSLLPEEKSALHEMEVEDTELRIAVKGNASTKDNKPVRNTKMQLMNDMGKVLYAIKTDASGNFVFNNLSPDQAYIVGIDENDPQLAGISDITIRNVEGKVVSEIHLDKSGKFEFQLLEEDKAKMGNMYVDDPWLSILQGDPQVSKTKDRIIIENIYYETGEFDLLPESQKILDKVVIVMAKDSHLHIELSAHTDSRASEEFNLDLSQKRAQAAVNYIIRKGISPKRISGKGYGESKLLNRCKDGVECSEEEHAQNRRTEFKVIYSK